MSIARQRLYLFNGGKLEKEYAASTSRNPPSCVEGSLGTPTGLHKIDGKIGGGEPLGTVFRGRKPCGTVGDQPPEERAKNLITTRIMRLRGLEDGKNSGGNLDTYARFVYFHLSNSEVRLVYPEFHGCVLLSNSGVDEIFVLFVVYSIVFFS